MRKKRFSCGVFVRISGIAMALGGFGGGADAAVSFTFNDTNSAPIDSRVGTFFSLQNEAFTITNNSGVAWTDFHVSLVGHGDFGPYDFMRFADLGSDGIVYTGPGVATFSDDNLDSFGYDDALTIDGLNVADGGVLNFTVDIFGGVAPEGLTSFSIVAAPSVDNGGGPGPGVPEPGTLALLGFGFAGLAVMRRRRRT
jgi:hypothetical protein